MAPKIIFSMTLLIYRRSFANRFFASQNLKLPAKNFHKPKLLEKGPDKTIDQSPEHGKEQFQKQ